MTKFSGSIWIPSETLRLLAEAAQEHDCSLGRHAELCVTAACRLINKLHRDIERVAVRGHRPESEIYLSLSGDNLQVIGTRSIDASVSVDAYVRAILILAVEGMAREKPPKPPPFIPGPKKADPGFRKWHVAREINEPQFVPSGALMGDPEPGRSALDQKRAMERVR